MINSLSLPVETRVVERAPIGGRRYPETTQHSIIAHFLFQASGVLILPFTENPNWLRRQHQQLQAFWEVGEAEAEAEEHLFLEGEQLEVLPFRPSPLNRLQGWREKLPSLSKNQVHCLIQTCFFFLQHISSIYY